MYDSHFKLMSVLDVGILMQNVSCFARESSLWSSDIKMIFEFVVTPNSSDPCQKSCYRIYCATIVTVVSMTCVVNNI